MLRDALVALLRLLLRLLLVAAWACLRLTEVASGTLREWIEGFIKTNSSKH